MGAELPYGGSAFLEDCDGRDCGKDVEYKRGIHGERYLQYRLRIPFLILQIVKNVMV